MEDLTNTEVVEQQKADPTVETKVQTPEELQKEIISGLVDDEKPQFFNSKGEVVEAPEKVVAPIVPTFTPNPIWDQLKSRISTEQNPWDIPANVKEGKFEEGKTELDAIMQTIFENSDTSKIAAKNEDPFVQEYMTAKSAENFDRNAWLKKQVDTISIFDLKGKEFVKEYYTRFKMKSDENPDGYTEEDINTYVDSKNRIELDREADVLSKNLKESMTEQEKKNMDKIKEQELQSFNNQEEQNRKIINTFIETNKLTKDFFGIEFSEAERTQFYKDLPGLFQRDPQTRMSKMDTFMQSENDVIKLAAILWLGEKGMRSRITDLKEDVKEKVEEKLGVGKKIEQGNIVHPTDYDPSGLED